MRRDWRQPIVATTGIGERLAYWESSELGAHRAAIAKSVDMAPRSISAVDDHARIAARYENVRDLGAAHRLSYADLPSGLTSHACLPVLDRAAQSVSTSTDQVEWASRKHQAAPKGSVLNNCTPA